jgi:hypothetical protein
MHYALCMTYIPRPSYPSSFDNSDNAPFQGIVQNICNTYCFRILNQSIPDDLVPEK